MRLNDHDEDREECTLVLIEMLAFLALGDSEARDYLLCLDTDGHLTQVAIDELEKMGVVPLNGFRPLAILTLAHSDERNSSYWNDLAPFIYKQAATATRNFQLRIAVSRLRRVLEILCWLSFHPIAPFEYEWQRQMLKLYRRYQQPGDTAIQSDVFDVESFLTNPLWQAARTHARRCMELLGMSGSKPTWDIYRLSMEFED
jgi:hypothetical protein